MRAFRFLMTTGYELFGEQHEVLLSSSVDNIVTDVPGYWWEDSIIGEMIVSDRWPDVMGLLDYVKQTYRDEY